MTKGKLDKIVNSGMKAKLILIGICAILLIVMIVVLCLTGGEDKTTVAEENSTSISETSDAQPETTNAESSGSTDTAGSTQQTDDVESGPEGTVNQQEAGEAAQVSEAPTETSNQPETAPENAGDQQSQEGNAPEELPPVLPDPVPSPTDIPQEPQPDTTPAKPPMMFSVEQQDDEMVVTTGYGVVAYPFAFSDIIQVSLEETQTGAALKFTASIREQTAPLYTLWFNTDEGAPYAEITAGDFTSTVNVESFEGNGLTEENMFTFNAAQETINDVLKSLGERNQLEKEY